MHSSFLEVPNSFSRETFEAVSMMPCGPPLLQLILATRQTTNEMQKEGWHATCEP
jgi:hypothetical protein